MVLRRITVDNSVRYIPKNEQPKKQILNETPKRRIQILENKTKWFHKTMKSFLKIIQHKDSIILNE